MCQNYNNTINSLIANAITITVMESCTGGLVQSMLTDIEGVSAIFKGGFVTYSNEAKIAAGVPSDIIAKYGVYSAECAEAMARAAQSHFNSLFAIGVTGSTGNIDPNNPDSVVGEVYYCILKGNIAYSYHYTTSVDSKSRGDIKQEYADQIFQSLSTIIEKERLQ
ncbi:MAG: nicotinamide-nucleotide amidohydrolase family protein [Bacteroidia bacterium]|nr:nicotinamide-nucleotide amidohydrolase family protein [Bacteroidia bacterium]